jgi:hypothetical protein
MKRICRGRWGQIRLAIPDYQNAVASDIKQGRFSFPNPAQVVGWTVINNYR